MKLTRFRPLIAAARLAAPPIQAGEGGPYVSLDGGAFFMDDIGTPLGSLDTDTGFGINAAVGYHLADLSLLL